MVAWEGRLGLVRAGGAIIVRYPPPFFFSFYLAGVHRVGLLTLVVAFSVNTAGNGQQPPGPPQGYLPSRSSTPTFTDGSAGGHRGREPYVSEYLASVVCAARTEQGSCLIQPAWSQDANIPLSKEEIEDVLIDLANKFGFQKGENAVLESLNALWLTKD